MKIKAGLRKSPRRKRKLIRWKRKSLRWAKRWVWYGVLVVVVVGASVAICTWVKSKEKKHKEGIAAQASSRDGGSGGGGDSVAVVLSPEQIAEERKERWEEYKIHVDLFKYYLDLILRTNLAIFAITGAILTFYFKNRAESKHMRKALYLPCCVCLALSGFYFYCACLWLTISETVDKLRGDLGITETPYVHILSVLLCLFGIVFLGVGEALIWFIQTDKAEEKAALKAKKKAIQDAARFSPLLFM